MDVVVQPVLFSPSGTPLRPWEDAKAGVIFVAEYPLRVRARANPMTECCRRAPLNDLPKPGNFKKDVKIEGTNSTSRLESTKVPKNKPKTGWKKAEKRAANTQKSPDKAKERPQSASLQTDTMFLPNPCDHDLATPKTERTNRECP